MIVNVEFLVNEPIENVITSLHFEVDKTIFFGFEDVIEKQKRVAERFLLKHCGVKEVRFYPVSRTDFGAVQNTIRKRIAQEREQGNQVFFDITGGEPMIMVAFGMLSEELCAPVHFYDIPGDRLMELNAVKGRSISKCAARQRMEFDLDKYIEMQGGVINYRLNKALHAAENKDFEELMPGLWKVSNDNAACWNSFSDMLKRYSNTEYGLTVELSEKTVQNHMKESKNLNSPGRLSRLLEDCSCEGLLEQVNYDGRGLFFKYRNAFVKECILNTGSILELHTYMEEKADSTDCLVGIHLDWDGFIRERGGEDVLNEVDVLVLHGFVPTFISCKNGHVGKEALYELEAVADKFGGKYAKKVLVATRELTRTDANRAKEMGIEVR